MRFLLIALIGLLCLTQFDSQNQFRPGEIEHPAMNLPSSLRQRNWGRSGSCVVASMTSLLRWQGKLAMADHLKSKYSGGQYYEGWNSILDREGIKYACTHKQGDIAFLERAIATRRGCMTGIHPDKKTHDPLHMVCLVDLTATKACILDNNDTSQYIWISRSVFLDGWKAANSWALTPVYSPTSPRIPR